MLYVLWVGKSYDILWCYLENIFFFNMNVDFVFEKVMCVVSVYIFSSVFIF